MERLVDAVRDLASSGSDVRLVAALPDPLLQDASDELLAALADLIVARANGS